MAVRTPKFTRYTDDPIADLPVGQWSPGMSAVPDELLGHHMDAALLAIGFDVDHPEDIRTGLLSRSWHGHPPFALVVATSINRLPSEPFVVSEAAVATDI